MPCMRRTAHSTKGEQAVGETRGKQWADFRELKATVTFDLVLERLDIIATLKRVGDELQGPCPICHHSAEKSRSFNVNVTKQIFQCVACKRKGNVLDFAAAMRHTDVHAAALWLRDEFLATNGHHPSAEQHSAERAKDEHATSEDVTSDPPTSRQQTALP